MGEAYFYQLTRQPLEVTLRVLLEKSLAQPWRVAVRGRTEDTLGRLDAQLWLGDGFLPHGRAGGAHDADQPVLLTTGPAPNAPDCLVSVEGADVTADEVAALARVDDPVRWPRSRRGRGRARAMAHAHRGGRCGEILVGRHGQLEDEGGKRRQGIGLPVHPSRPMPSSNTSLPFLVWRDTSRAICLPFGGVGRAVLGTKSGSPICGNNRRISSRASGETALRASLPVKRLSVGAPFEKTT